MPETATVEATVKPKPKYDSNVLFRELSERLRSKPPEVSQRVVAHLRAKTNHQTLPSYHNNGASEQDKVDTYLELLKALLKDDWTQLQGQIASGQAKAAEQPKPEPKPEPEPKSKPTEVKQDVQVSQPVVDPKMAALVQALAMFQQQSPAGPAMGEAEIRELVASMVGERMKDVRAEAMKKVDDYISKIPPREVLEIRKWDGTVTELKERYHKQFPMLVKMLSARNASGFTEFVYAYGAAGAGKTYLLMQLAKALGVAGYPFPCGPTTTEGRILGFNNIANGSFVAGWLYKPYKEGGLVGLDEIALSDASVLGGTNSIENAQFTFGNGEMVQRHKDFYLIAFDNTLGTGSTQGFIRNKLDAATLNRFSHVKLEYDHDLEREIFGNRKWADYVIRVREYVEKNCNASFPVTPRATRKGAAYLAQGIPIDQVMDSVLFGLCSKEVKTTILSNVGPFKP